MDSTQKPLMRAKTLRIKIIENGKTVVWLPGISLKLLSAIGSVGFKLALKFGALQKDHKDLNKLLPYLKELDTKEVFEILINHEPFELVNIVDEKSKTEVIIRTE